MKTLSFILLIAISFTATGQVNDKQALYTRKVEKYGRVATTGLIMLVSGVTLVIIGSNKISHSETQTTNASGQTVYIDDPRYNTGILMVIAGVGLSGVGATLGIVGEATRSKYQRRLKGLSVRMNPKLHQAGLVFTYKF